MTPPENILTVSNLTKSWPAPGNSDRQLVVLDSISFALDQGKTVAIQGPSGSGKSTLLNIIGSLDNFSAGSVKFKGKDLAGFSKREISHYRNREIGIIFQKHYLLPQCTVLENVLIPTLANPSREYRETAYERARELLKTINLGNRLDHLPSQLSVGECQRTAMVRALINDPPLLLADEPTGSLDKKNSTILLDILFSLTDSNKKTLILVTHSDLVAQFCNNRYLLENGTLARQ